MFTFDSKLNEHVFGHITILMIIVCDSQVMRPFANALDHLQAEKTAYMGVLLPTLHSLRRKLVELRSSDLQVCEPLVAALIDGLDNRFNEQWYRRDLVLAAVLHPAFQFAWIKDDGKEARAKEWLTSEYSMSRSDANATNIQETASSDEEESIFDFKRPSRSAPQTATEVTRFLACPSDDLKSLSAFPTMKKLFIKFNTPIPSSAGVERIFSAGGLIFSEKRGKLTDRNFENCLLLKVGLT
jgi:hypothetical protein